ncbi:MAG: RDD family protein [Elusimicrobiota bacterium]|jgi:uncharacterized RDD family membrane protein YckC|nr:RDD family protein [Elusimicrobiota bacterium]
MENNIINPSKIYAGFWKRFIALIIDAVIISFCSVPFVFIFRPSRTPEGGFGLAFNIFVFFANLMYYALLESSPWQATIGKKIIGIKVVDLEYKRIDFFTAAIREFSKILSGFILCLGYIMAAFTSQKRALHDFIGGTLVVNDYFEPEQNIANIRQTSPVAQPMPAGYDGDGLTPLMRAVYNEDSAETAKILKEYPDMINKTNPRTGVSALWMAAAYGNTELIKILLAAGADTSNTNKEGLAAAAAALRMGHTAAAELLSNTGNQTVKNI